MKNKEGFTLIEILVVILILGVIMLIAVPTVSKYTEKAKRKAAYISVTNIVNSIKTNEDGSCFYNYNYQEDKKTNVSELIILKKDNQYSVYAEMNEKILISVDDFKETEKDKENTWIGEGAFEDLGNLTEEELSELNICKNLYGE